LLLRYRFLALSRSQHCSKVGFIATTLCCLLAAVPRLHTLADANPWWDEGFTLWLASQDLPGMLLRTAGDTHPPLSYFLYQLWMPLAGRAIYALRFQAVLFGVLAVPVCGAVARRLGGPLAGVLAALLVAILPFHIWWSQQVRMYSLVALLCALSIYFLFRSLEDGRGLAPLAVVNMAGLYTLYFFAVLVFLEGILVAGFLIARRRREAVLTACSLMVGPLLLLPWLAYFRLHAIRFAGPASTPLTWAQFAQASWGELMLGADTGVQRYSLLLLVLAAAALAVVLLSSRAQRGIRGPLAAADVSLDARHDKPRAVADVSLDARHDKPGVVLALWLALTAAGLPLAAYGITLQHGLFFSPEYQTRYDLLALPALLILLAWSLSRLPRPAALAFLALFAGAAAYSLPGLYDARHRTDDYQSLARFVQAYERPGDAIVFDPDKNFHLFLLDYQGRLPWEAIPLGQSVDAAYADQIFSRWSAQYPALWLLQEAGGHDAGAQHPIRDWLQSHLRATFQLAVGDRLLTLYEPAGAAPRGLSPTFAPARRSGPVGFDQPLDDVRAGDVLHLAVYTLPSPASAVRVGPGEGQGEGNSASGGGPAPILLFAGHTFPARQLLGQVEFAIPIGAGTPPGWQPITLRLSDGRTLALSSVYVEARPSPPPEALPPLENAVGRGFGGQAALASYRVRPQAPSPGQDLTVELQWRALQPFSQNYTVFVHLLDRANHVVAQRDAQPRSGQLPTVRWQPGQVIDDAHVLPLPADLPAGEYHIEVGLYLQSTGERLRLSDGPNEDHLILGSIQIP